MRPWDLAAIGLSLAACMMVVQATWTPPLITPAQAGDHIGERVRMEGMVLDLRRFDDGGLFVLTADGAAVHARYDGDAPDETAWIEVTATIDRDGGRPLLRVEVWQALQPPQTDAIPLASIAQSPEAYTQQMLTVRGHLEGSDIHDDGASLRTTVRGDGSTTLQGVIRYEPRCLCYFLHAWTP